MVAQRNSALDHVRQHLDGERKNVTVLFADIVNSSGLIADKDPEDAHDLLLPILQVMIDSVHRFGGTVNQVLGDGIMALFGAPFAQEDHAIRACLAADEMHSIVKHGFGDRQSHTSSSAALRVGLCSGEVVTQTTKTDLHNEYRAVGETVHLAARMESFAKPGSTILAKATLKLSCGQVQTRRIGEARLSPKSVPVDAFELVGINLDRINLSHLFRGSRTPFVGRERDLISFRHIFNKVQSGAGQVLVITGDAGVGKSRLVFEFLENIRAHQHRIVECNLLPTGWAPPLEPLARVIRDLFPIQSQQPDNDIRESVSSYLESLRIRNKRALPAILEVLSFQPDEAAWVGIDPDERLHLAVETVAQVITAVSRQNPLVIIFEDFHWADSETRLLADELAVSISSFRVLFIVTSRTHHEKAWRAWPGVIEHEVRLLSRGESGQLVRALLGAETDLDELKDLLAQKTEGNPFFLEECIRALEGMGNLTGAPGSYRLAVPVANLKIPLTVHGVLAARIDALSPADKSVLLCASVIGERFDVRLLGDLVGTGRRALLVQLSRLRQAGFIERTRIVPNLEYSFRHALIHDVAYRTLLKRRRRELHAKVMAAIEKRLPSQLPGKIELLAHHALCAEKWPRAYAYGLRAGQKALEKSRNHRAADHFENALQALEQLPQTRKNALRSVDIKLALAQSLVPLGEYHQAHRRLLEARDLAEHLNDERCRANISSQMTMVLWTYGHLRDAIKTAKIAVKHAKKLDDPELEVLSGGRLGALLVDRGDYDAACKLLKVIIARIPDNATHKRFGTLGIAAAGWRAALALSLGELGRFSEAIQVGDEGIRIVDELGHTFTLVYTNLYVGHVLIRKGDFERSLPLLERSFSLCNEIRSKLLFPLSAATLGYAYVRTGKIARGLPLLEEATMSAERQSTMFRFALEFVWLAEAYLLAGRADKAVSRAWKALELAKQNGEAGHEAWALWSLGEIHHSLNGASDSKADRYFCKAQKLAVSHRMAPLVAHCHFGLGRLNRSQKLWDAARCEFDTALSLYRELEMGYWLRLAQAELKEMKEVQIFQTS